MERHFEETIERRKSRSFSRIFVFQLALVVCKELAEYAYKCSTTAAPKSPCLCHLACNRGLKGTTTQ